MSSIDGTIVNVALPTLTRELSTGFATIQWVVLSYLLGLAVLMLSMGRLGDAVCPKLNHTPSLRRFDLPPITVLSSRPLLTDFHSIMLSHLLLSESVSSAHHLVETTGPRVVAAWRGLSFAFYFYFFGFGFAFGRSLRTGLVRTM